MYPARFVAEALRQARTGAGLTARQVAEQLEARGVTVSRQHVSAWEHGVWAPAPSRLLAVAALLDIAPMRFMLKNGEKPALAELRVAHRGLTQGQLAAEIDMPRSTYSLLERGGTDLTPAVRIRLAAALQVDVDTIERGYRESVRLWWKPRS